MSKSRRVLAVVPLLILFAWGPAGAATPSGLPPGTPAPAFSLSELDGKQMGSQQWQGKVLVLNFWAFWCDTWKAELPQLKELAGRQQDLGFRMAAISVDGTRLQEFLRRTRGKMPFPVLLDVVGRVSEEFRVSRVPTVVVINAAGRVVYACSGYPGNAVLLTAIRAAVSDHRSH